MTTEEILTAHKILRAAEVVEAGALAGLPLAAAATLLQKESGGGKNIYGHDRVKTGGFYTKGGDVTPENYALYKEHRKANGAQGVGPCQLTYPPFQDRADAAGGCWDWRVNALVGFEILADLVVLHGVRGGFRRYNGAGPAAERYADDALKKFAVWRTRLRPSAGPAVDRPTLHQGDRGPVVVSLQTFLNRTFPAYSAIDLAPARYGASTSKVVAEFQHRAGVAGAGVDAAGKTVGPKTWAALERFGYR